MHNLEASTWSCNKSILEPLIKHTWPFPHRQRSKTVEAEQVQKAKHLQVLSQK